MGVRLGDRYGSKIQTSHIEDRYKIASSEFRSYGNSVSMNKYLDREEARRLRDDLNEFLGEE